MNKYKIILFDLDGTIIDSKLGITNSVMHALSFFNINVEDRDSLCKFIGPPLKEAFLEYCNFDSDKADIAVSKYREYYSKLGVRENVLYDGIKNLLKQLKENGKTIILATSKPTVFAEQILKYFTLDKYFTFISGSELNGTRTKKAEVIEYALQQNNILNLQTVVMVGDREHDIIGAKEIGVDSIGVLYGYGSRSELEDAGANYIVDNVNEILKVIDGLGASEIRKI